MGRDPTIHFPVKYFLHLLDAHNVGQEAGVDERTFRSIFHVCHHCGRYMTSRMASPHHDKDEFGESDSGDTELQNANLNHRSLLGCIYLRKELEDLDALGTGIDPRVYREKHLSTGK